MKKHNSVNPEYLMFRKNNILKYASELTKNNVWDCKYVAIPIAEMYTYILLKPNKYMYKMSSANISYSLLFDTVEDCEGEFSYHTDTVTKVCNSYIELVRLLSSITRMDLSNSLTTGSINGYGNYGESMIHLACMEIEVYDNSNNIIFSQPYLNDTIGEIFSTSNALKKYAEIFDPIISFDEAIPIRSFDGISIYEEDDKIYWEIVPETRVSYNRNCALYGIALDYSESFKFISPDILQYMDKIYTASIYTILIDTDEDLRNNYDISDAHNIIELQELVEDCADFELYTSRVISINHNSKISFNGYMLDVCTHMPILFQYIKSQIQLTCNEHTSSYIAIQCVFTSHEREYIYFRVIRDIDKPFDIINDICNFMSDKGVVI